MPDQDAVARLSAALGGRYRVERQLGEGGMATVYLAEDLRHRRNVALKVLLPDVASGAGGDRFLREIETSARLTHPHILPLHDSGTAGGLLYYVMPFVDGESLRARLERDGAMAVDDALRIAVECADALVYAHDRGVLHRDIKPANILLAGGHAVLADFGIARALEHVPGQRLTRTGVAIGTLGYMSPEQATGNENVDARTDIYALGCVLYEMLTGEPAFRGRTAQAVLARQLATPPAVSVSRPSTPAAVQTVIHKALQPNPADRFATAAELRAALRAVDGDAPTRDSGGRARRSRRWLTPVGLAVMLATLVAFGWLAASRADAPAPRLGAASVAVLPFTSGGAQGEDAALFADGMHSEILTQLQKLGSLEVIGHASVLVYEGTSRPFAEIARELGVATLLEATVFRAGGRFRLNVRLIDGVTGRQLWAEPYEDELSVERLFRTQEAIAVRIANALDVTLSAPQRARLADRPITTEGAYDHYLRGESHARRGRFGDAVEAFADAVEADPSFAAAWAALANSRALAYFMANGPKAGADEALEQARLLAPDAPATHMAAGNVEMFLHARYDDALRNFARAAELLPGSAEPLYWSGVAYTLAGRLDDARALSERALRRDPLDHRVVLQVGFIAAIQWRFRDAKEYFDRAVAIVPDHSNTLALRWDVHMWGLGDTVTARSLTEGLQHRAYLHYVQRDTAALRAVLDQMQGRNTGRYEWLAFYHRLRGDAERQRLYGDSMTTTATQDLEGAVDEQFLDWVIESGRARLALAYALAGRERDAVRTIEEAVERVARQPDRLNAAVTYREEARVYTVLGDATTAIQRLDALFSDSSPRALTPVRLRLDPDFDALRGHPAFAALLDKYEPLVQR